MSTEETTTDSSFDSDALSSAWADVPITREEVTYLLWQQQIELARIRRRITVLEDIHEFEGNGNTPKLRADEAMVRDEIRRIRDEGNDE